MTAHEPLTPARILLLACFFEASLLVVAYAIGWLPGVDPLAALDGDASAALVGLAAVVPMVGMLWWGLSHPDSPAAQPTFEARDFVNQFFQGIGWGGFALVSLLAGLCEEALFRGLLQTLIARHSSELAGLLAASVLFGLAHAVSLAYAVLATFIGLYLGLLYLCTGSLVAPVVCHAVYDFVALIWLSRTGPPAGRPR